MRVGDDAVCHSVEPALPRQALRARSGYRQAFGHHQPPAPGRQCRELRVEAAHVKKRQHDVLFSATERPHDTARPASPRAIVDALVAHARIAEHWKEEVVRVVGQDAHFEAALLEQHGERRQLTLRPA